jgi:amidohydrolase
MSMCESGKVFVSVGPVMANSDRFEITVLGKGGHGAIPQGTVDPILAASTIVLSAQQIVSRNTDPATPAVVSFGGINSSSSAPNVIPERVSLMGTCRCYSPHVRSHIETRLAEICRGVGLSSGATVSMKFSKGYDAVVNDEAATRLFVASASKLTTVASAPVILTGSSYVGFVFELNNWTAFDNIKGEDFFYYRDANVDSCFAFLGCALGDGVQRAHHSPEFDFGNFFVSFDFYGSKLVMFWFSNDWIRY